MTSPVTIDLSKAQPIQAPVTLDLSKAQPIGGQSAPGQKLGFTGEMNPETRQFQDVSVDQPQTAENPILRFGRGALDAITGALKAGPMGVSNEAPPVDAQGKAIPPSFQSMKDEIFGLIDSLTAKKERNEGDYAGAAGKILTNLAMMKSADSATGSELPKAAVRGVATAGNAAIQNAPTIGTDDGAIGGLLEHGTEGGLVGAYTGNRIGKLIKERAPTIPGQDFGLQPKYPKTPAFTEPQRVADISQLGPPKPVTPEPQAESGAAAEARAHFEQKLAARKSAKPATSTPEATQQAAPLPSENDVAKGMGYKSAQQAQERLGPQQWQETYNKIAKPASAAPAPQVAPVIDTPAKAQKAVSDLVDQVAPKASAEEKVAIDSALQKGDVQKAEKLLDDVAEDKELQQRMREDFAQQELGAWLLKSRLHRAGSDASTNKGSLMTAQQVVDAMPSPAGTMETNKLLGYEGRRTIPEATAARAEAMRHPFEYDSPWGRMPNYQEAVKQFLRLHYGEGSTLKPRPSR